MGASSASLRKGANRYPSIQLYESSSVRQCCVDSHTSSTRRAINLDPRLIPQFDRSPLRTLPRSVLCRPVLSGEPAALKPRAAALRLHSALSVPPADPSCAIALAGSKRRPLATKHSGCVWERGRLLFGCPRTNRARQKRRTQQMFTLNQITLIGFTGSEAEVHHTQNGTVVAVVSVATKESWKDADGEWQSRTD